MGAPEDAGSISAEIRLELEQMNRDALQAQKMMDSYALKFKEQGQKGGKMYVQGFGHAQLALNTRLNNMVSSLQGVSPKLGALGSKMASVFSKPIFAMVPAVSAAFQAMLPVIGTIIAAIGVLIKIITASTSKIKEYIGNVKLSKDVTNELANANSKLNAEQRKAADADAKRAQQIAVLREVFQKLEDIISGTKEKINSFIQSNRVLSGIINTVNEAFVKVKESIVSAGNSVIEFARKSETVSKLLDKTNELVKAGRELVTAGKEYTGVLARRVIEEREIAKEAQKLVEVNKEIIGSINNRRNAEANAQKSLASGLTDMNTYLQTSLSVNESYAQSLIELRNEAARKTSEDGRRVKELDEEIQQMVELINREREHLELTKQKEAAEKELANINEAYEEQLQSVLIAEETGFQTSEEAAKGRVSAMEGYINSLIRARNQAAKLSGSESDAVKNLENQILQMVNRRNEAQASIASNRVSSERMTEAQIAEARMKALKEQRDAEIKAKLDRENGLIDEKQKIDRINQSNMDLYRTLQNIVTQNALKSGATVNELAKVTDIVKNNVDAAKAQEGLIAREKLLLNLNEAWKQETAESLRAQAETLTKESERKEVLQKALKLELELFDAQRKRAWEAIENSDEFILAQKHEQEEIEESFNLLYDLKRKALEKPKSGNWLADFLGLNDKQLGNMMQIGGAAISAFDSISGAALDIIRRHAEEQMAIIEKTLNETLDSIQKAREADLIAAGFAVENNIESLEAQLEAAKRTGDEVLIYQLERRKKEQEINDEWDAKAKEAEEKAAREKAEIEFKLAKQEHAVKMISAANAGAMAVLNALASPVGPPVSFILAGLAGTAAAAQIGMIASNPPAMPKFAHSGIVPGNKYFGDRNVAAVDSGELILNRAHQDNIAGQLTANSGPVTATIVIMLDGREIGQNTFDLANKGYYTLNTQFKKV